MSYYKDLLLQFLEDRTDDELKEMLARLPPKRLSILPSLLIKDAKSIFRYLEYDFVTGYSMRKLSINPSGGRPIYPVSESSFIIEINRPPTGKRHVYYLYDLATDTSTDLKLPEFKYVIPYL